MLASSSAGAAGESEALALLKAGDLLRAEPLLASLVAERGNDGRRHYFLGFCRLGLFRFSEAEISLRRAVALDPSQHAWLQALAKALLEQGKHREAGEYLERAIALAPLPEYRYARAVAAVNAHDWAVAESQLRACLEAAPAHGAALHELGSIEADRGQDAEAALLFGRALAIDPDNIGARFRLGLSRARLGQHDEARESFEAVLGRVPRHVGALYNLARAQLASGQGAAAQETLAEFEAASRLEDAIRFREEHVRLAPEDAGQRLLLAELLLGAGHAARALEELEHARRLQPHEAEVYLQLAKALRRVGRPEEARRAESFVEALRGSGR